MVSRDVFCKTTECLCFRLTFIVRKLKIASCSLSPWPQYLNVTGFQGPFRCVHGKHINQELHNCTLAELAKWGKSFKCQSVATLFLVCIFRSSIKLCLYNWELKNCTARAGNIWTVTHFLLFRFWASADQIWNKIMDPSLKGQVSAVIWVAKYFQPLKSWHCVWRLTFLSILM